MAFLAIKSGKDAGLLLALTAGIFLVFMLIGTGISSYVTFEHCGKTDSNVHFQQGAFWSLYPTLSFVLVRSIERFRIYFDRFYRGLDTSDAGAERAGWVSVGYVMMLGGLAGYYALLDSSIEKVCIPTMDEATRFKEALLKQTADKAKAQESTPAVST
jgi:hypothetical protein